MASPTNEPTEEVGNKESESQLTSQKRRIKMAEKKITQKDLYNRIAEYMVDDPEVVEFCHKKIEQLEKAAQRPRKTKVNEEVAAFREDVLNTLWTYDQPATNKQLSEHFGVSAQKMSAALRFLVKEGKVMRLEGEKKSAPATFEVVR